MSQRRVDVLSSLLRTAESEWNKRIATAQSQVAASKKVEQRAGKQLRMAVHSYAQQKSRLLAKNRVTAPTGHVTGQTPFSCFVKAQLSSASTAHPNPVARLSSLSLRWQMLSPVMKDVYKDLALRSARHRPPKQLASSAATSTPQERHCYNTFVRRMYSDVSKTIPGISRADWLRIAPMEWSMKSEAERRSYLLKK